MNKLAALLGVGLISAAAGFALSHFAFTEEAVTAATDNHLIIVKQDMGQFSEICPNLKQGQKVVFELTAKQEVLFNLHYHKGDKVTYPIEETALKHIKQSFEAPIDQTYCLMWKATTDNTTVKVDYHIE